MWSEHIIYLEVSTGTPVSLSSAQEVLGPLEIPWIWKAKGINRQMLEQWFFLQLNVVTKWPRRMEDFGCISLLYENVPSKEQMGSGDCWRCLGLGLPPSQPWWEQSDLLSHPLPLLPWSSCPTQDICPQCAVRELNCPRIRTFSHENRPPIDLSDRKWLWELGPHVSKFMGLCSTSTGLRQTVSLLTLMYLTL